MAFEFFLAFFYFFKRSLIPKKSGGMQESYMWVVFHPNQKPNQNSHFNLLWAAAEQGQSGDAFKPNSVWKKALGIRKVLNEEI